MPAGRTVGRSVAAVGRRRRDGRGAPPVPACPARVEISRVGARRELVWTAEIELEPDLPDGVGRRLPVARRRHRRDPRRTGGAVTTRVAGAHPRSARLVRRSGFFVVRAACRPDSATRCIVLTNTWNAYNDFGWHQPLHGRGTHASFARPLTPGLPAQARQPRRPPQVAVVDIDHAAAHVAYLREPPVHPVGRISPAGPTPSSRSCAGPRRPATSSTTR